MKQYKDFVKHILETGEVKEDRTGTGTISTFGYQMRFDLSKGFPLVTLKNTYWKGVVHELLWFLSGDTNIKYLVDNNVHIWDEWADEKGNLGPVYGAQWTNWIHYKECDDGECVSLVKQTINQIDWLINEIKTNPSSRRLIVSAWNVGELENMALPPCHSFFQFYVQKGKLSCQLYQRSADSFLGVPFNIASYSLLIHMIAHICNLEVGEFIHSIGDCHIYLNHMDQINEMLSREPKELPTLNINRKVNSIYDFKFEDFDLINYNPHPSIKAPVAV